jgi:sigmaK-factor processing regulatory protein BofA
VEALVLVVVVVVLVLLLMQGRVSPVGLAINAVVGVVLLILTNLVLSPPIPINALTVLICAIGGVVGWLILLLLHVLAIAF